MEQFFTKEKANNGIEIPLSLPDGSATEYYLLIRGVDSDHFREAEADSLRKALDIKQTLEEKDQTPAFDDLKVWLIAQLVLDWNLPEECNEENIIKLFLNAPQIKDEVNRIAGDRKIFFKKSSKSSMTSQKKPIDSPKGRKGQSNQ